MTFVRIHDSEGGRALIVESLCVACGDTDSQVCLDHDRWIRPYRTRILCLSCNLKKGNKRYVAYGERCWLPGMPPGARIPNVFRRKFFPMLRTPQGRMLAAKRFARQMGWITE